MRWLIGLSVLLILLCAAGYLAVNVWVGYELDKAREHDEPSVGQVRESLQ